MAELEELSGAKISDLHRERSVSECSIRFRSVIRRASTWSLEQVTELRVGISTGLLNYSVSDSCHVEERRPLSLSWMWGDCGINPPTLSPPGASESL